METYDIFSPAEVEREPITQQIIQQVEKIQPRRVFLEAMTQFRYLTADAFQYHKQALSFLRFLVDRGATVLLSSEGSQTAPDDDRSGPRSSPAGSGRRRLKLARENIQV